MARQNTKRDGSFAVPLVVDSVPIAGLQALDNLNVLSLPALGALGHVELDALAFLQ